MITIITVTYNAASTIERTMRSVAMQSYKDYEHLVVDGASKDATVEIAEHYDCRIISEPDKGLYDAMNKGIREARGEWLVFLNAGDRLHSADSLQQVAEAIKAHEGEVGVVYGDTDIVDDEGTRLRGRRLSPPEKLSWRSFSRGMLVCHQSFYINRTIALPYDLSYRFSADFDWCIRCMKEGEKRGMANIAAMDRDGRRAILTDYLSEGMTTANHKASLRERFRIMVRHYGWIRTVMNHAWFVVRSVVER